MISDNPITDPNLNFCCNIVRIAWQSSVFMFAGTAQVKNSCEGGDYISCDGKNYHIKMIGC